MNETFKGTIFQEIDDQLTGANFTDPETAVDEDSEEVIGECTALEKAVFTLSHQKIAECQATCDACDDTIEDRASDKCARVKMIGKQAETLHALFWQLLEDRLNRHESSLGVREGFQIVVINDEAAERMQDQRSGIQVIQIGFGRSN